MVCVACDGSGWLLLPNAAAIRCKLCETTWRPVQCRAGACLDAFACNVAGACSLPSRSAWDWAAMEPGDVKQIPLSDAEAAQRSVHSYASRIRHTRTFRTRTGPDCMRVWRIT